MTDQERELAIQAAYDKAIGMQDTSKPTYQGTYDQQIADTLDKITNREKFTYDVNTDPLYASMKDRYISQGKLAMQDTMGKAASLTGGYGSSYGQAVGQQQYDAYLQNLTDSIPELASMAYQMYQDEGEGLQNQLSIYQNLGNTEYNRYRDQLTDWNYDQQNRYNLWTDAYNRVLNEENTAYNREQDAFNNQQALYSNLYQLIGATGYSPSDDELAAAGMSRGQADALIAAYQAALAAKSASSSGGGSGGGGSGGGSSSSARSTGTNGNTYSINGYTGDKIYNTLEDEAAQAWLEDDLSQYVKVKNKGYTLSTDKNGKTTYSSPSSSKAATDAINKVLASIKKK